MKHDVELIDKTLVLSLLKDAEIHLREGVIKEDDTQSFKVVINAIANMYADTADIISKLPIVDAVLVVRCKDCKNRHSSEFCECRPDDAFCSDGERRE